MQPREKLICDHLGCVKVIAKRIHKRLPSYIDYDDVYSNGLVGLVNAADRYKIHDKVPFSSYATYRITGAILDGLRGEGYTPRNKRGAGVCDGISFNETDKTHNAFNDLTKRADTSSLHADYLARVSHDPFPMLESRNRYMLALKKLHLLPLKIFNMLTAYYIDGRKLKEIATTYGVSESRICQLTTMHVNKLLLELDF